MPWLPYTGQGGLLGWGPEPQLHAQPIGEVARAIMAQRALEQQRMQQGLSSLSKAIQDARTNQVADALTRQYEAQGLIPQGMGGVGGQAGLAAANQYMQNYRQGLQAQQYSTYPTQVPGVGTFPMTVKDIINLNRTNAIRNILSPEQSGIHQDDRGRWIDADGNIYRPTSHGFVPLNPALQPNVYNRQAAAATARQIPNLNQYVQGNVFDPVMNKGRKIDTQDLDVNNAWQEDPSDPNSAWLAPVINPSYDVSAIGTKDENNPDKHYPGQYYVQTANPNFGKPLQGPMIGPDVTQTITHTARIPNNVWDKFIQSGGAEPQPLPQTPSTPPAAQTGPGPTQARINQLRALVNDADTDEQTNTIIDQFNSVYGAGQAETYLTPEDLGNG